MQPVAKKIAKATGAENYNILQNNGRLAHQLVDHVGSAKWRRDGLRMLIIMRIGALPRGTFYVIYLSVKHLNPNLLL